MQEPIEPMLAKAVDEVPPPDAVEGGVSYEPKWDGFRAIVYRGEGDSLEIGSRGSKSFTRYFPELVQTFLEQLPPNCVVDGEIVVRHGPPGAERLDWSTLSQRIHPAESRIKKLSVQTPASFIAFDLIAMDGTSYVARPFSERREALEKLLANVRPPIHLTRTTKDVELARRWLVEFEGAGLDGVITRPLAAPYTPNKRTLFKTKHARTADVVLVGYRVHKSGSGVGSLLLGLYDAEGNLRNVGGASAFSDKKRKELVEELDPLVIRDAEGNPVLGDTDRSRFSSSKDVSFIKLEPTRVVEVHFDQMEGPRFRHAVQFSRWRPDRDARSCTYEQLERPVAYDLAKVLT